MKHPLLLTAFTGLLLLAACSTDQRRVEIQQEAAVPLTVQQRWWAPMQDPLIDLLADRLVAQNLDMQIAVARIHEARGLRRSASGGFFPQIGLSGNAGRGNRNTTQTDSIAQGGFDASWEIDVFGRVRHAYSAADARVGVAQATAADVRNSMIAELVRAVVDWRQAQETLRLTTMLLASQDDQISLVRSKTEAGLINNSELERALAQRQQTATQQPLAKAAATAAQHQIERLLAAEPGTFAEALNSHVKDPIRYPVAQDVLGLDISNLRGRPDLRAKRAALLAGKADLAAAEAELLPKLTLGAFFGGQEASTGALIAPNPLWSVALAAAMPLIDFGKIRGSIDAADARAVQAELEYENATLLAMQETHTALSDYLNGLNAVDQQKQSLEHRKAAVSLANERFTTGLSDMTDLTTAQSELDEATITFINRQAATAQAFVRLQKALGSAVYEEALEPAEPDSVAAEPEREESVSDVPVQEDTPPPALPAEEPVPVVTPTPTAVVVPETEKVPVIEESAPVNDDSEALLDAIEGAGFALPELSLDAEGNWVDPNAATPLAY